MSSPEVFAVAAIVTAMLAISAESGSVFRQVFGLLATVNLVLMAFTA
jgi:hypothetical protein